MLVKVGCVICGKVYVLDLDKEKLDRWHGGELIQNVFPELSEDDRELLITHTCGPCFDTVWGDED